MEESKSRAAKGVRKVHTRTVLPSLAAPSPKKQIAIFFLWRNFREYAAPTAWGSWVARGEEIVCGKNVC
jgi:hypothetical protein